MGGDPESPAKKQLGKIMLQQKLVSPGQLPSARAKVAGAGKSRKRRGSGIFGAALASLAKEHGVPAVDLTTEVVALATLRLIPVEIAREHQVLPFGVEGDGVRVAMAAPGNTDVVEEVEFVTGKKVLPHVALEGVLRGVIEQAYAWLERGDEHYVGACVTDEHLAELGLTGLEPAPFPTSEDAAGADDGDRDSTPDEPAAEAVDGAAAPPPDAAAASSARAATTAATVAVAGAPEPSTGPGSLPAAPPPPLARQPGAVVQPLLAVPPLSGPTPPPPAPTMPLDTAFAERIRPSQPPAMPSHQAGAKVLVAMPAGACRDAVAAALAPAGLTLVDAFDGTHALELAERAAPRALVIEAGLEGVHGFEVCRRLMANSDFADKAIIVVSNELVGWRLEQDARESLGIRHFFSAPVDAERLAQTVRLAMEHKDLPAEPPPLSEAAEEKWNLAMDAFDSEDLDGAIAALEEASKLDPTAFEVQYHLGLLYGRRDDLFFAIQALERAIAVQPHHFSALKNLAVVYQRAGFHRKAVDSWQRASGEAPDEETRDSIKEHMMSLL